MTIKEPFRLVRTYDKAGETGLEIWRLLGDGNDPKTEQTCHNDLRSLTSWTRCSSLSGLREYILNWEDKHPLDCRRETSSRML